MTAVKLDRGLAESNVVSVLSPTIPIATAATALDAPHQAALRKEIAARASARPGTGEPD